MEIYLASGNIHKKEELQNNLPNHKIILPKEIGLHFNPEETGKTFFENAMIKAKALFEIVKKPVIADDSGLCIDYLNGAPGIYSARYGINEDNSKSSSITSINKVLSELKNIKNRKAYFVCCLIFLVHKDSFNCVQEICKGSITEKPFGTDGFGYDPIFFVNEYNKTFAELTLEEKNLISHRGLALKKLITLINT